MKHDKICSYQSYVCDEHSSITTNYHNILLVCFDSDGDLKWDKIITSNTTNGGTTSTQVTTSTNGRHRPYYLDGDTKDNFYLVGMFPGWRNSDGYNFYHKHSGGILKHQSGTAVPEISIGFDTKDWSEVTTQGDVDEANSWMVGLTWKDMFQPDDRIGLAFTQPLKATEVQGGGETNEVDPFVWEAYYSFRPNDSMEIRPAIFGGTDVYNDTEDDIFGAVLTTMFIQGIF